MTLQGQVADGYVKQCRSKGGYRNEEAPDFSPGSASRPRGAASADFSPPPPIPNQAVGPSNAESGTLRTRASGTQHGRLKATPGGWARCTRHGMAD